MLRKTHPKKNKKHSHRYIIVTIGITMIISSSFIGYSLLFRFQNNNKEEPFWNFNSTIQLISQQGHWYNIYIPFIQIYNISNDEILQNLKVVGQAYFRLQKTSQDLISIKNSSWGDPTIGLFIIADGNVTLTLNLSYTRKTAPSSMVIFYFTLGYTENGSSYKWVYLDPFSAQYPTYFGITARGISFLDIGFRCSTFFYTVNNLYQPDIIKLEKNWNLIKTTGGFMDCA